MNCKMAVLDLETTGLSSRRDRIVEIGIAVFKNGKLSKKRSIDQLVNPGIKIPREAIKVHGITDRMVKNMPSIRDIKYKIKRILKDVDHILTQNGTSFDLKFLKNELGKRILNENKHIDLLHISRFLDKRKGRRHNLEAIKKRCGISSKVHRALSDAVATYICLRKLFLKHGFVCVDEISDLI